MEVKTLIKEDLEGSSMDKIPKILKRSTFIT